ncbi:MAG TPA: hypothetical protein VMS56_05590 [Thermoanaerobaculia bacterium]|nr:hypothetical protein [Thermoanaerobaculia bacterium]
MALRSRFLTLVLLSSAGALLGSCATNNSRVTLVEPEFRIIQVSGTAQAARHITGPLAVNYHAEILNRSSETITLRRIQVESMGEGAYNVRPTTHPFEIPILPNQIAAVEFWVPAFIQSTTIVGANGPVTLRAKVEFDSDDGMFQKIYVQQVNAGRPRPFSQ